MFELLLLYLLMKASERGGSGPVVRSPGPPAFRYPPVQPVPDAPIPASVPSGPTFSKQWLLYKPLNEAVIARAMQLLKDPNAKPETIERDPSGQGGMVRFLKLNAPPGKTSVTAWRPNPAYQAPGAVIPA